MIFVLFLCIKLSLLNMCFSKVGFSCTEGPVNPIAISLIYTDDEISNELIRHFYNKCQKYYKIILRPYDDKFIGSEVEGTLNEIKTNSNVINLYVPDYVYHKNNASVQESLVDAGDITDMIKPEVCNATNKEDPKYDCHARVKLVSRSVETINFGDLFDFVTKIQVINGAVHSRDDCLSVATNTSVLQTVLLCYDARTRDIPRINIKPLRLQIAGTKYCMNHIKDFKENFLAVLAPRPFEVDYELQIPVIFYETPYELPEFKAYFPNSMTLAKWNLLKYGFLSFLRSVDWSRVAIVSDDSKYSSEFETELTTLFSKERITYMVIKCETAKFDMDYVISKLNKAHLKPSIVIANVEEQNAKNLIKNAPKIYQYQYLTWLVRDKFTFQDTHQQRIFSFSLSPRLRLDTNGCNLNDKIIDGLNRIVLTSRQMTSQDFMLSKKQFYRKFVESMKKIESESSAYVHQESPKRQRVLLTHVYHSGYETVHFTDPFVPTKPLDRMQCIAQNNNYFTQCEDELVLIVMFVIIMFASTLLLITCYFHKTSPFHDIRYHNFR